ncbi:hypothetical protein [Streptomyces scabiei]|uniref:hypothetical protein n=1 Tax=Streptomyces scabiei TaxID=1930 RepID=UPI0029B79547|nr:hypothetical protein [Streptomyces scabiei]MDX3518491.1 hypothetical protein [Streptomyces scabiei]
MAAAELAEARALAWDYATPCQSGRPTDSGSIDILPLAEVLSDRRETIWFSAR